MLLVPLRRLDYHRAAAKLRLRQVPSTRHTRKARHIVWAEKWAPDTGLPILKLAREMLAYSTGGGLTPKTVCHMPTDLFVAIAHKAELTREIRRKERNGVLLIPLIMALVTIILAVGSPSFAAGLITAGLN